MKLKAPRDEKLNVLPRETIALLGSDAEEILVERVKPLRDNPGTNEAPFVTRFNEMLSGTPH